MSFNNDAPKKRIREPFFSAIDYSPPDPNIIDTKDFENRYHLMTPQEKRDAERQNRLFEAGLITDPKLTKNARMGKLSDETVFLDPYPAGYKARLGNAYQFDSIIRVGIDTLVHYILGRDFEPKLRPVTRQHPREETEFEEIMNDIIPKEKRDKLLDYINYVDHTVKLKTILKPLLTQKYVYGRSAGLLVRANAKVESDQDFSKIGFIENTPLHIKPLNSYYLGQNHYDTKTWEIEEIEYNDPKWIRDPTKSEFEQPALKIEDLIYFTHSDYGVIPNSHGYGMSALENILALSGANRRINEKVLPELNTQAWAGTGIFKFTGMSAKQMSNFVKSILPSTWKATNQELEYVPIKIDFKDEWLLEQRDSNVKHIATQLRIPSFLINFEDVTNRSIGDRVSNIWQQGDLEFARDELRDQLWEYWYRPLMELYYPDDEFLYIRTKILIEFQSIDFSNFFEKAIAGGNLVQNNIFSISEVRELLGRPPYPEDQKEFLELVEKAALANPEILAQLRVGQGLQGQPAQLNQQSKPGGGIGQQGLSVNVNNQKVRSGTFDEQTVTNRIKKGVKQPKNFR